MSEQNQMYVEPTYGGFTVRDLRESIHSRGRAVKALPDLLDWVDRLEREVIRLQRENHNLRRKSEGKK